MENTGDGKGKLLREVEELRNEVSERGDKIIELERKIDAEVG